MVRRAPNTAMPATTASTTAANSSVDTAITAGERFCWTSVNSLTGNVMAPGPEMVEQTKMLVEHGWDCVRFMGAGQRATELFEPRASIAETVPWLIRAREAVGHGVSLGIDMTLHLVQRFLGRDIANETARILEYRHAWKANGAALADVVERPQKSARLWPQNGRGPELATPEN